MYRDQKRYGNDPAEIVRSKTTFDVPLKWKEPAKVFTCSWSDFFIEDADKWRDEAWDIIRRTPHLTYQILTKRPGHIEESLPHDWGDGWDNVWLGVSVESSDYLWRLNVLAGIPAKKRFISYEPALGPLDSNHINAALAWGWLDWVISGGESGPGARPAKAWWFMDMRDYCIDFSVPYFHKQNGGTRRIDGHWGGNELGGEVWQQMPH